MVTGTTNNVVAYAGHGGVVHGDGVVHPNNVDGVYVTENYVGPLSTILGCVLLGPFLCPLVFLCPVRMIYDVFRCDDDAVMRGEAMTRREATNRL